MKRLAVVLLTICLISGCYNIEETTGPEVPQGKTGTLIVNVVWPEGVTGKNTGILRYAPDKITAYIYHSGIEITRKSLTHEGSYGTAELTINALSGYRLDIVATHWIVPDALYTGMKDNITIEENSVTTVDITMCDVAPVLSVKTNEDLSYTISWTRVPLADLYHLEEAPSSEFCYEGDFEYMKLSDTVYSGPDSSITFTGHKSGTFYYVVFAVTSYGDSYEPSPPGDYDYNFGKCVEYGAMSNIVPVTVQSGDQPGEPIISTGTIKIRVPWPTK